MKSIDKDYMPYILKLKVDNPELEDLYTMAAESHNKKISENALPDSGFDLFCPEVVRNVDRNTKLIDLGVKAAAYEVRHFDTSQLNMLDQRLCRPYKIHTRSSIYKTKWRLANNTGIIDAGYRGNLKAAMDFHGELYGPDEDLKKEKRYWQICMPTLEPFKVYLVDKLDNTERGEGGHGSTGK